MGKSTNQTSTKDFRGNTCGSLIRAGIKLIRRVGSPLRRFLLRGELDDGARRASSGGPIGNTVAMASKLDRIIGGARDGCGPKSFDGFLETICQL